MDAWVLMSPTAVCLQWFIERNLRAISVIDTPTDRDVACVYIDTAAALRHAVGLCLKRGYSRVVFLTHDRDLPSRACLENAFMEAFVAVDPKAKAKPLVVRYSGGVPGIQRALDSLLTSPIPRTAILVALTRDVSTVMCHLANSGIRVPQQVGLISLGHLPFLDGLLPSIAHYMFNWKRFAKKLAGAVHVLLTVGELPQRQISLLPEFREGNSIAESK